MYLLLTHHTKKNNYIESLAKCLKENGIKPINIGPFFSHGFLKNTLKLVKYRRKTSLLHIHWFPFSKKTWHLYFLLFKILRYKIIYTAHNLLPHDHEHWNKKAVLRLYEQAAYIITHYTCLAKELRKNNIRNRIKVLPHPNFNYKTKNISRSSARNKFGFLPNDFVILFFGLIRSYKGLETLVDSFKILQLKDKRYKLLICGDSKKGDETAKKIQKKIQTKEGITFINHFLTDLEIETAFQASDLFTLPFKKIYGSGSLLLAYDFNLPFISLRTRGNIEEVDKYGGGLLLHQITPESLANAIIKAAKNPPSFTKKRTLSWGHFAKKHLAIYRGLNN